MQHKKSLPYSKPLSDLIKLGYAPTNDVNLFIGLNAWKKGKNFSITYPERTLVLPAWNNPFDYYWPVNGCDVLVFDTGYAENDYVNDIAYYLYINQASVVRLVTPDFQIITFTR